jgi:hypothetical protein
MNNLRLPQTDSATFRGLVTALQALFTFIVGFILAVWQVPGVPKVAEDFVWNNAPQTLISFGIPLILGTGIVSFLFNRFIRRNVSTY